MKGNAVVEYLVQTFLYQYVNALEEPSIVIGFYHWLSQQLLLLFQSIDILVQKSFKSFVSCAHNHCETSKT